MATGVLISSFSYFGAPSLSAIFGFFKTSSSVQIQRLQITGQTKPAGGNITVQLVDESGNAYSGATVTLPSGASYYDQALAAPITLGLSRVIRAQITAVDNGSAADIVVNLMGATAQNSAAPGGNCGAQECFPPQAQLMFFQGSVAQEMAAAAASAASAAASAANAATSATNSQNSATNSQNSATDAANSATNAQAQVTLAAGFTTAANNASAGAAVYAGNAAASATTAAASAAAAAASAAAGVKGVRAQITAAAVKTISNATPTAVIWDSVQFDDMVFWDGANPTRLTIPAGVTRVRVSAGVRWVANATGERKLKIRSQNGPYAANSIWASIDIPSDDAGDATVTAGPIDVVAGMYFEAIVEQDSTGNLDLNTVAADNPANFLSIEVLKQT